MLTGVEHEKSFITSGPDLTEHMRFIAPDKKGQHG